VDALPLLVGDVFGVQRVPRDDRDAPFEPPHVAHASFLYVFAVALAIGHHAAVQEA